MTTIAAIATGVGGGVGIIRVSGPLSRRIAESMCRPFPLDVKSHHLYLADFYRMSGLSSTKQAAEMQSVQTEEILDQGLFCFMKAPHSYTGEDVLELHAHGGSMNLKRLLQSVLSAGASPAAPGEFTKRAFLSGKLDLTQAEAIAALIGAQSMQASKQAQRQLHGEIGQKIVALRFGVLKSLGALEGTLDFPDLDEDQVLAQESIKELTLIKQELTQLSSSFSQGGKALAQGIEVVLFGQTNAGKSSLINALCQAERVLVDAEPGTTRDFVEVKTQWKDVPITLIDTAGKHALASKVERQGLSLGKQRGRHADVVLLVIDGTADSLTEELDFLREISQEATCFLVFNKMDKQGYRLPSLPDLTKSAPFLSKETCIKLLEHTISCSALCGFGLEALQERILQKLAPHFAEETVIMSQRQAHLLDESTHRLQGAIDGLSSGLPSDIIAAELRMAAASLGQVTGEEVTDSVLDEIFSQFCIGK